MIHFVHALVACLFLLGAAVQINDPDPLAWIFIYALAALVCIGDILDRPLRRLRFVLLATSALWALSLAPEVIGKVSFFSLFQELSMNSEAVELGREMGGLLLLALWMLISFCLAATRYRINSGFETDNNE